MGDLSSHRDVPEKVNDEPVSTPNVLPDENKRIDGWFFTFRKFKSLEMLDSTLCLSITLSLHHYYFFEFEFFDICHYSHFEE